MAEPNDAFLAKNPAYRPATEEALVTGLLLLTRFAGDSSGSPLSGLEAVSVEPPSTSVTPTSRPSRAMRTSSTVNSSRRPAGWSKWLGPHRLWQTSGRTR